MGIRLRDNARVTECPAWAMEQVEVHPPNAAWQDHGEQMRRQLNADLNVWLLAPVEHVGSTAVPGLPAKPVLDLQAAVADLTCAPEVAEVLAPDGWNYVPPELDERPWRRFFVRTVEGRRAAHLHLMRRESPRWGEQLVFRDALCADPALRHRYAALKEALATQHSADREAY